MLKLNLHNFYEKNRVILTLMAATPLINRPGEGQQNVVKVSGMDEKHFA